MKSLLVSSGTFYLFFGIGFIITIVFEHKLTGIPLIIESVASGLIYDLCIFILYIERVRKDTIRKHMCSISSCLFMLVCHFCILRIR